MGRTVDEDPALVLGSADQAGLLTYLGYVTGDRYEVQVLGRDLILAAAQVGPLVERLRAVADLRAAGAPLALVQVGDEFGIDRAGHVLKVPGEWVVDWCAGFRAAMAGGPEPRHEAGEDHIAEIAELVELPSLDDQLRRVILGFMYGQDVEVTREQLAKRIVKAKKTVVDALAFGKGLGSDLAAAMIRAFGVRWSLEDGGVTWLDGRPFDGPLPQMPALVRLDAIVAAARAGWVRYLDNPKPNYARRLRRYRLAIGSQVHVVSQDELLPWLKGVGAFHGV